MKLSEYIKKYGDKQVDVEKLNEVIIEDKVWKPKLGEDYWYVSDEGDVYCLNYDADSIDEAIWEYSGLFKTRKETVFYKEKKKFLLFMEREFIRNSDEIDWENGKQIKHSLVYLSGIAIRSTDLAKRMGFYTTNKEWLIQFMEEHEDDIKKYYFEVKE